MNESDLNATIAPSLVQHVLSASPASKGEEAHLGLPNGRIVANSKWRDSRLIAELKKHVSVIFTDVGSVDFYPSEKSGVVYVSELDLTTETCYRRNLAKLRNSKLRGFVLYEKSDITKEWFYSVQKFVVLDLGLTFFPVNSLLRAAQILVQIEKSERRNQVNRFTVKKCAGSFDDQLFNSLNTIPGLGPAKTKLLLKQYKSIAELCKASLNDLTSIVGKAAAQQTWNFFHQS